MESRQRKLPQVWKWYFLLPNGRDFTFSLKNNEIFFKAGAFLADSAERRYTKLVWPFRRVRTTQLVRDALPGGLSSADIRFDLKNPGKPSDDISDATKLALYGSTHPELSWRDENGAPRRAGTSRRIKCTLDGEKPFADDGRTGPSA